MKRREFLKTSAIAAGASLLSGNAWAAAVNAGKESTPAGKIFRLMSMPVSRPA